MINKTPNKKIRCAIYTRKSHEEGLDQEFNSLDAQRVAAESYIASQIGEGWCALPTYYDDGGYSGGNLERPALQRLLKDIKEGGINCIVVYKIDRLTRSLFDFSKIIELFDQHKVSFVSVTQSFNTSSSMGRLMLNVLLSFSQYERELTGERIRDKFSASRKKGIWMGGNIPLGYNLGNRRLIINEEEAKTIKLIYNEFIETKSVSEVVKTVNQMGLTTKSWISEKGKAHKGKKFSKNIILRLLNSPLYLGKVEYKGEIYDGQHEAIISEDIAKKVQTALASRKGNSMAIPKSRITSPPILKGLINCGLCGCKMSPTHTSKKGKKYQYYVCSRKIRYGQEDCRVGSISAKEIEDLVKKQILQLLKKPEILVHTISAASKEISEAEVINYFKNIEKLWDELFPVEQVRIISLLIKQVIVTEDNIDVRIFKEGLNSLASEITVN
jgi:DNA invertase Pin-like site-specific DNA recombinase